MFRFHEKRKLSGIFFSKGMMLVLFVLCVLMAYATLNAYDNLQEAAGKRAGISGELSRLEARAAVLTDDIEHLEDPRGVETELRRRYDVSKEGEEVIVFVEPEREPEPLRTPVPQKPTFLERLVALFVGE